MHRREHVIVFAGAVALVLYAAFLIHNLSYAIGGPDTGSYFNEARTIAAGHMTRPVALVRTLRLDDSWLGFFMPLGFAPSPGASMHPIYPAGLPIHLAAAAFIGGWERAPFFVAPLAAVGCLVLIVAVARSLGLSLVLSMAAATVLAGLPPFLWHAVQPASDVLATFWGLATVWFALKARQRPAMAVAAGIALGIGAWVRPTNALLVFPLILAVRLRLGLIASAAAGALPFGVALMWWNTALFGGWIRTGYGGVTDVLSWEGMRNAAPEHAAWLARFLTPLGFPGGLFVLADRSVDVWTRWMLIVWFVPFYVFYSFYGFFDGWLCIRFLLPAIPALLIGALLILRDLHRLAARRYVKLSAVVAVLLVIWIVVTPLTWIARTHLLVDLPNTEKHYPRFVVWAEQHLPKRAIVVSGVLSGPFLYYANRSIVRYDQLNDERFQILRAYAGNAGLPWYAVVGDGEIDQEGLQQRFRGRWTIVDHLQTFTVYRLDS
ncbi:MAG TPA: hypothetical protein VGS96_03175 [Thermoanaerobaculia bacterium]|jgi:4-amino-4-deoxy-L-arabinose transferase-like glycosyltransferase|nr:hypothetical protein [Thermoanaerobaculia bacterium]